MKKSALDSRLTVQAGKNYNIYTLGGHIHTGRVEPIVAPGIPDPDLVYLRHIIGPGVNDLVIAIDVSFITAVEEIP